MVVLDDRNGDCLGFLTAIGLHGAKLFVVTEKPHIYTKIPNAVIIPKPINPKKFINQVRNAVNMFPKSRAYFIWHVANKAEALPAVREKLGGIKNFKRTLHIQTNNPHDFDTAYRSIHLNSHWANQPLTQISSTDFHETGIHFTINEVFDRPSPPEILTLVLTDIDTYNNAQIQLLESLVLFKHEFDACNGRIRIITSAVSELCEAKFQHDMLLRLHSLSFSLPNLSTIH